MNRRHKRRKWAKRILKKRQRSLAWGTAFLAAEDVAEMVANTLACICPASALMDRAGGVTHEPA